MPVEQIFLSYCHRDDEPYGPQDRRWVEEFERALRESIGQRVGPGRVELWRDKRRLAGNELFDQEIAQQLDRSAILVTVLSQHYLKSDYCRKEFQSFGRRHIARGDLHVDHLSRIVKVYRRAIDRGELRRFVDLPELIPEVDRTVGFDLYYKDDSGIDRDVLLDPDKVGLYWQRADDIAYSIKRMLDAGPRIAADAKAEPVVVYLAHTASDMRERCELLRRELEDRGCRVLPEQELPEEAGAYAEAVRSALGESTLSIHLLGARYGVMPEGADRSGVALQAELALQRSDGALRSLFWAPPDLGPGPLAELRQQELVERLEQAAAEQPNAEFIRSSIDQLKAEVAERLRPRPAPVAVPGAGKGLYLLCDGEDRADARPLQAALTRLGFVVTRASIEGTTEELLEENKANFVGCDVVVVVWGKSREAWVRSKLRDAQQAPGWGRDCAFRGKFVVIAPPDTPAKQDFEGMPGVTLLRGLESADQLERLLQ